MNCIKVFFLGALAFLLFSCKSNSDINPKSVIKVSNGQLTGIGGDNSDITVYKGVPYAAPPVGDLRWQPPHTPLPWKGIYSADAYCKSCMQNAPVERRPWTKEYLIANDTSEDCLGLNIWTAAKTDMEKLPVIVWLHGGGFVEGSGEVPLYNGEKLASQRVIVVTVNYRLGVFGFFAHKELTAESPYQSSGNYGILDQIAALQWINDNIAAFGGDPDNVTVAGQSAGAMSVNDIVSSPLAKGLFHQAITQSNVSIPAVSLQSQEEIGKVIMDSLSTHSIEELRRLSAVELLEGFNKSGQRLRSIIDGWVVPAGAEAIYSQKKHNDVPMLNGITNFEFAWGNSNFGKMTQQQFEQLGKDQHAEKLESFRKLYPSNTPEELASAQLSIVLDPWLHNMRKFTNLRSDHSDHNTYNYLFSRATPWPDYPQYRAFHSSEIPYVFANQHLIDRPWEAVDKKLEHMMSSYWVNFMKYGDPNGEGLPEWPSGDNSLLNLGDEVQAMDILSDEKWSFYDD